MKISNNIVALRTLDSLTKIQKKSGDTMQRLSSGIRINKSKDDSAGLAISNKMNAQIKGLKQANRNTMDGISMVQTGEAALNEMHTMLQRAREISVQASSETYTISDCEKLQDELNQILCEINRMSDATEFNGKKILSGKEMPPSGLSIEEMSGGNETDKAQGKLTVDNLDLEGTYITIDGVRVDFYNSDNEEHKTKDGLGIDLKNVKTTDDLALRIKNKLDGQLNNLDMNLVGNEITFTSKKVGVMQNNIQLKDGGTAATKVSFQTGANDGQLNECYFTAINTETLGLTGKLGNPGFSDENNITFGTSEDKVLAAISIVGHENATYAIEVIDNAIEKVSVQRASFGATQNRLEYTVRNLAASEENLTASLSRVLDTDMAYEMAQYTQQNVMSQASTAMLAQANQRPQQILQLLNK